MCGTNEAQIDVNWGASICSTDGNPHACPCHSSLPQHFIPAGRHWQRYPVEHDTEGKSRTEIWVKAKQCRSPWASAEPARPGQLAKDNSSGWAVKNTLWNSLYFILCCGCMTVPQRPRLTAVLHLVLTLQPHLCVINCSGLNTHLAKNNLF